MEKEIKQKVTQCTCERCGYSWVPKKQGKEYVTPMHCAKCNNPYWNRPRKNKRRVDG